MTPYESNSAVILLVEDNPADQRLTQRALKKGKVEVDLRIVEDGEQAMDYLLHQGKFSDAAAYPTPDLILLDINMPRMDGKQVLRKIKEDPALSIVPIVMLTTSDQEQDIIECYQLGVNAYINKPVDIADFIETIQKIEDFWFNMTILPQILKNVQPLPQVDNSIVELD